MDAWPGWPPPRGTGSQAALGARVAGARGSMMRWHAGSGLGTRRAPLMPSAVGVQKRPGREGAPDV